MLTQVISGGQTGVDQAALRAAKASGLQTGGWAPAGWRTEAGSVPWLGTDFGLREANSGCYTVRTKLNIETANGTLIMCDRELTRGSRVTRDHCRRVSQTHQIIYLSYYEEDAEDLTNTLQILASWIADREMTMLNVAGSRESQSPGIGAKAEAFLLKLFPAVKVREEERRVRAEERRQRITEEERRQNSAQINNDSWGTVGDAARRMAEIYMDYRPLNLRGSWAYTPIVNSEDI